MKVRRSYKVELAPNKKQLGLFNQYAGAARFAYNWGLERRIAEYKGTGKSSSAIDQHKQIVALKHTEFPWLKDISKCVPQEALRNLDKAFQNFFRRVKQGKKGRKVGFPKFKSRNSDRDSFKFNVINKITETHISIPCIGLVRLKEHNYLPASNTRLEKSMVISRSVDRWFVCISFEEEVPDTVSTGESIGIDLGIKEMAVCSDGRRFENPKSLRKNLKKLRRISKSHSRKKKGSKNREKAKRRLARLHYRISCIRKDAIHKATSVILARAKPESQRPSCIVLEDLNVKGMVKNRCLAQAISDVGFYTFRRQIEYKAAWQGTKVIIADRFYASSKICSVCGLKNDMLSLSDRSWTCKCGAVHDRDLNAAKNLKFLSTVSSTGSHACGDSVRPETNIRQESLKQE